MRLSKVMRGAGDALARGEISLGEFFRRTRYGEPGGDWARLAAYLLARIPTPEAVEPADVEAELAFRATRAHAKFDPARSACCASYLVWVALSKTKGWLHAQRGAKMRRDPATRASNVPICASRLDDPESKSSWLDGVPSRARGQEERASAREALASIFAGVSARDREVLELTLDAGGDPALGASAALAEPKLRRREWLDSERAAVRLVDSAISAARKSVLGCERLAG